MSTFCRTRNWIVAALWLGLLAQPAQAGVAKKCFDYLKKALVGEVLPPLEPPKPSRTFSSDPEILAAEGELQRAIWAVTERAGQGAKNEWQTRVEKFLESSNIVDSALIEEGTTSAELLALSGEWPGGGEVRVRAVFKKFRPESEIAAYRMDKLLQLDLVPVVVAHSNGRYPGSIQLYVDEAVSGKNLRYYDRGAHGNAALEIFDYVIGNLDRYPPNYLITLDTHRVVAIDNGESFGVVRQLANLNPRIYANKLDERAKRFVRRLAGVSDQDITQTLNGLVDSRDIKDVLNRRKRILKLIEEKFGFKP